MNDALRMQISAFVDGELPENESELLLRRLSQDIELRNLVEDYMRIGQGLRGDSTVPGMESLRGRIAESLGEDARLQPAVPAATGSRFVKPIAGFAVAASVAVVAIFALQQTGEPTAAGGESAVAGNQMLDEMFRYHESSLSGEGSRSIIGELASFEIELDDDNLVRVAPKAELVSPVEVTSSLPEEEEDAATEDSADN